MEISSDLPHRNVPNASKWSIRSIRGGPAGDVVWMLGIIGLVDEGGKYVLKRLEEVEVTADTAKKLQNLLPGAIINKVFGCGTKKQLEKH